MRTAEDWAAFEILRRAAFNAFGAVLQASQALHSGGPSNPHLMIDYMNAWRTACNARDRMLKEWSK